MVMEVLSRDNFDRLSGDPIAAPSTTQDRGHYNKNTVSDTVFLNSPPQLANLYRQSFVYQRTEKPTHSA